jgi:hypothetical protein
MTECFKRTPVMVKVYCLILVAFNHERDGTRTPKSLPFGIVEVCGLLALG